MMPKAVVNIVDDDPAVLRSMRWLIESAHLELEVHTFSSGPTFLQNFSHQTPSCVVLDMRMPGMNGRELQELLVNTGNEIPVIFMTGHGDVAACAGAFRLGAFDFIEKPADDEFLLTRIQQAIAEDAKRRQRAASPAVEAAEFGNPTEATGLWPELTAREIDVVALIVAGRSQKQIATELAISVQTVAKHRARVLEKLGVDNNVELVRLALKRSEIPVH